MLAAEWSVLDPQRKSQGQRDSRNEAYGMSRVAAGLFRLRAGEFDDLGPFFCFFGHEPAEVSGRNGEHGRAKVGKPRPQLGIGEARVDLLVELVDDLGGR